MTHERYRPLPDEARVHRMVKRPGGHWPEASPEPLASMLQPTPDDVAEGARSGRGPGVSVFDAGRYDHDIACWLRSDEVFAQRTAWFCFTAAVCALRAAAPFGRNLDVVTDPLHLDSQRECTLITQERVLAVADAHALIEGIEAPPPRLAGTPRTVRAQELKTYNDALQLVLDAFRAH